MQQAHIARLRRLRHRVRQLRQHATARRTASCAARFWAALRAGGPGRRAGRRRSSTIPRPARFWPIGSSRGRAPSARRPTSTATAATSAARRTAPTDLIDPVSTLSGATPELRSRRRTCSSHIEKLHGFLDEWTQTGEHLQPEVANYLAGPLPRRAAARLGRLAAGAVLRLRDSRQPGQLLVRLVRRADRLHRLDAGSGASGTARSSTTGGERRDARSTTSSARTSRTSTRCSGRRCSRRPASACRRRSTSTAS